MYAGGSGQLGQALDLLFDVVALRQHKVGQFVDHQHDVRQEIGNVVFLVAVLDLQRLGILRALLVERADLPDAGPGEELVAALHFHDQPVESVRDFLQIRQDRHQQMGNVVEERHLHRLGVDKDELQLVRAEAEQKAHEDRVYANGFAGTGGAGHQKVRRFGQVFQESLAVQHLSQRHHELHLLALFLVLRSSAELREENVAPRAVRYLHADRVASGNGSDDTDGRGFHRHGDLVFQGRDAVHLHARAGVHFIAGDGWAADNFPDIGFHAVLFENIGQYLRLRLGLAFQFAHIRSVRHIQKFDVGQLIGGQVALVLRPDHRHRLLLWFRRRNWFFRNRPRRDLRLRYGNFHVLGLRSFRRLLLFLFVKFLLQFLGCDRAEKRDYPGTDLADAEPQEFQNGGEVLVEEQRQGAY